MATPPMQWNSTETKWVDSPLRNAPLSVLTNSLFFRGDPSATEMGRPTACWSRLILITLLYRALNDPGGFV